MASVFDREFEASALPDLMNVFAEAVVRYPSGSGAGVPLLAIVHIEDEEFDDGEGAWIRRGRFQLPTGTPNAISECGGGEGVQRDDKFLIRGTVHNVETIGPVAGGLVTVGFIASRRTQNR